MNQYAHRTTFKFHLTIELETLTRLEAPTEVYEHLVGSPAFKAAGTGEPRSAGSIPVHLRQK